MPAFKLSVSDGSVPVCNFTSGGAVYLYEGLGTGSAVAVITRVRIVVGAPRLVGALGPVPLPAASLTRSASTGLTTLLLPQRPLILVVVAGSSTTSVVTGRNGKPHARPAGNHQK